jgi:hypothetical protein
MEVQMLLRDSNIYPSDDILKSVLGDTIYSVLESFLKIITNEEYGLTVEWRFYNDGKAWLCKVIHKKKTILWLSIWTGFFKISFYFTEKYLENIEVLDVSETIKKEFSKAKPVGRLIPMIVNVTDRNQVDDLLTIVRFKKSLK